MVTDAFSGRCPRAMRSRYAEEMEWHRELLPAFLQRNTLSRPIRDAVDDDDASCFLYGQAAALSGELAAPEIVDLLVKDTAKVLAGIRSG